MNLQEARQKIDAIDKELVKTFEERLQVILEIARIKEAENISIYEPQREQEVLAKTLSYVEASDLKGYVNQFVESILDISKTCQKQHMQQHIFLIGMPGAGKTTVGKALAQHQGMEFYDLDAVIQEKTGKSIQNIIIYDGEDAFRKDEFEAITDIVNHKMPAVIATGGGTVLSEDTVNLMRESGFVVFIHRDVTQILDDLDMEIRPLLKESIEYIFRLYEERYPLYEKVCHVKVQNASTIADSVEEIVAALPNVVR
ncbi:chorismate mutase [Veillonella intestinalis]|uniref:chorismate mutase n=1 Tax=Veillonella intestinalis TaxID=2941341 RepID=UPI00203CA12D|nr:chorismate mutase [Veillonella intestinalis]